MIATMVLAAGASRRLGRPKQLEIRDGQTLLRAAAQKAIKAAFGPVAVVVGHRSEEMRAELIGLEVELVSCSDWEEGMAASLRAGVAWASALPAATSLLVTLVDQYRITSDDLQTLARAASASRITAARYEDVVGVPALFPRAFWPRLAQLHGDQGARKILREEPNIVPVELANAGIDLDCD